MWGSTGKSHLNGSWVMQIWMVTCSDTFALLSVSKGSADLLCRSSSEICYMANENSRWLQNLQWIYQLVFITAASKCVFYLSCKALQCLHLATTCYPRTIQSSGLCNSCKINKYGKLTPAWTLVQTLILKGVYHIKFSKYKMCCPIHMAKMH